MVRIGAWGAPARDDVELWVGWRLDRPLHLSLSDLCSSANAAECANPIILEVSVLVVQLPFPTFCSQVYDLAFVPRANNSFSDPIQISSPLVETSFSSAQPIMRM